MGVVLNDRHIAMQLVAEVQPGSSIDQPLVEIAALGRQAVTDPVGKLRNFFGENLELPIVGREPSSD